MSTATQGRAREPRGVNDRLAETHNTASTTARFWSKVSGGSVDECWPWTAAKSNGYGAFYISRGLLMAAHRWAYLTLRGQIGSLALDHLCRNRACVNPWHLEPVTDKVNAQRGEWGMRAHCPQGHPYDEQNTARRPQRDGRECITCRNAAHETKRQERRRALAADPSLAEHGRLTTYNDWMCRCQPCRDASTEYRRQWRARRAA